MKSKVFSFSKGELAALFTAESHPIMPVIVHFEFGSKVAMRRQSKTRLGVFTVLAAALILAAMAFLGIPRGFHTRAYWLFTSAQHKREVFSSPKIQNQLRHAEWNGDGWVVGQFEIETAFFRLDLALAKANSTIVPKFNAVEMTNRGRS